MSKKRKRRRFTSEQKASILSEHLFEKKPVSEVCETHRLQPSLVYDWQHIVRANLSLALEGPSNGTSRRVRELEAKLAEMNARLAKKDEVIAEITEEYVALKKSRGER